MTYNKDSDKNALIFFKHLIIMQRPFIPLLLALIAGIALGYNLHLPDPALWIALAVTFSLLLATSVLKKDVLTLPLLMMALLILGILNINSYLYPDIGTGHISAWTGKEKITIDGMICESPQLQPEKTDVKIAAWRMIRNGEAVPVHGNIWLTVKQISPSPMETSSASKPGSIIRIISIIPVEAISRKDSSSGKPSSGVLSAVPRSLSS